MPGAVWIRNAGFCDQNCCRQFQPEHFIILFLTCPGFPLPYPRDALRALTGTANEVFALTTYQNPYPKGKIGVLEAGSYADLLLVDGDPTKSVSVLADTDHLRLIMKGGTVYKNTLC